MSKWVIAGLSDGPDPFEVQGWQSRAGEWFACENPERAFDRSLVLHDRCSPCLLAAEASMSRSDPVPPIPVEMMRARLERYGEAPRLAR
jgi:hypothetical protein